MKKLDPKAVWLFFISFILRVFFPLIFLIFYGLIILFSKTSVIKNGPSFSLSNWLLICLPFIIFFILCFVWAKLTYRFYRYELADIGFRKESGVIYKRYVTIPYDRIQNVDIYRGVLDRLLGLSDLHIQTAGMSTSISRYGGQAAEGRLPGLSRETAEQLRDELIRRVSRSKNQGL